MNLQAIVSDLEERDKKINSFIVLDSKGIASKGVEKDGKLKGMKIAVKSNICVEGLKATCGSKTLEDYVAPFDATVISRIKRNAGAIVGMTNMDEFACGSSGETSYLGQTDNPAISGYIPGGSSSGSAAAVAAGFVDAALGSDTGGSIRNPASHCGVVAFKPTYGVVSRYGLIDMAMSLDQIGPIAKDVSTAALMLEVIAGHDPKDATSLKLDDKFFDFSKNLKPKVKGMKLGYAKEFDELIEDEGIKKAIHATLEKLSSEGAEIVDVNLPNLKIALPTYYLNMYVEFYSATRKYDSRRYGHKIEDACGEEVLRRILLGSYISQKEYSGRYYKKALRARSVIRRELEAALKSVDALVAPTVPKFPHKLGTKITDPRVMYAYDVFTVPVNLAGVCAGVVPIGKPDGFPTGIQIIGKALDDQTVLDIMLGVEKVMGVKNGD